MATTKSRRVLPEQLPQKAVLFGVFYDYTAAAYTDRPADVEALLRAALPADVEPSQRRSLARSLVPNVGLVRWSERQQCLWFVQPKGFKGPVLIHPEHLTPALRELVLTEEPAGPLETSIHAACRPPTHRATAGG